MSTHPDPLTDQFSLSSAGLRYLLRRPTHAAAPGPAATRPLGLRGVVTKPTPVQREYRYCHDLQVAVDQTGQPLVESMSKRWDKKGSSDGDEGPEENWGWEE